jgi:hypothetical protein
MWQWIRLGANYAEGKTKEETLELLDSPGIIPAKQVDQEAALKLAVCNDIGHVRRTCPPRRTSREAGGGEAHLDGQWVLEAALPVDLTCMCGVCVCRRRMMCRWWRPS